MVVELALLPGRLQLDDNGFTIEEEAALYEMQLEDIIENPREYLDNLEFMTPYYVRWKDYSGSTPTIPYRFTLAQQRKDSEPYKENTDDLSE